MQAGLKIAGLRKRFSVLLGVNKNVASESLGGHLSGHQSAIRL